MCIVVARYKPVRWLFPEVFNVPFEPANCNFIRAICARATDWFGRDGHIFIVKSNSPIVNHFSSRALELLDFSWSKHGTFTVLLSNQFLFLGASCNLVDSFHHPRRLSPKRLCNLSTTWNVTTSEASAKWKPRYHWNGTSRVWTVLSSVALEDSSQNTVSYG